MLLVLSANKRPQAVQSTSKDAPVVCDVPDPLTHRGVLYEPPYLFETDPYPNYQLLSVSIRGYDYVVLEGYFRYIQKLAKSMAITVPDAYVPMLSFGD